MLPITRRDEYLYSVPKFDLGKSDIKDFMNELKGFHDQFADCFERSESREHFLNTWLDNSARWSANPLNPLPWPSKTATSGVATLC